MSAFPPKVATWARQMANARAARTFIEACEVEGIAVLPVKGIVSACTLYDDRADRPLTDVDVRVVPADVRRVLRLCRTQGWPIVQRMRSYANLVTLVDDVFIDVEAHVGPPGMCNLQVSSMIARARPGHALGFRARIPDFTDHAVLLVVNAFKDKLFGAFEWAIRDLEQIPRSPQFDAPALVARLRESGATTIGHVVAHWMVHTRGAREWQKLIDGLGPPRRPRYVNVLRATLARNSRGLPARVLGRMGADSPGLRARALARMGWWQAEVFVSKLGPAPYLRGFVSDEVRAKRRAGTGG